VREGLLPPTRGENNYRRYLLAHVERLAFVRRCRSLDMTLDEIRALIELREARAQDCGGINALLDGYIERVVQRIRELSALKRDLKALCACCTSPNPVAQLAS
jgi:DNA-binding transcriptional MerR regulator